MSWPKIFMSLCCVQLAVGLSSTGAHAQVGPGGGINPGRDCQTVLQCRFRKGGVYRGCISSYSCRQCRFVTARDCGTGKARTCQRLVCSWR